MSSALKWVHCRAAVAVLELERDRTSPKRNGPDLRDRGRSLGRKTREELVYRGGGRPSVRKHLNSGTRSGTVVFRHIVLMYSAAS
jgi:hypothetical protein